MIPTTSNFKAEGLTNDKSLPTYEEPTKSQQTLRGLG
jgi:hypothetical protein